MVWRGGSTQISIGEVTLRRARLVLGWAAVSPRYQPVRLTKPATRHRQTYPGGKPGSTVAENRELGHSSGHARGNIPQQNCLNARERFRNVSSNGTLQFVLAYWGTHSFTGPLDQHRVAAPSTSSITGDVPRILGTQLQIYLQLADTGVSRLSTRASPAMHQQVGSLTVCLRSRRMWTKTAARRVEIWLEKLARPVPS